MVKFAVHEDYDSPTVILVDWRWAYENENEIVDWMIKNTPGFYYSGLVIKFNTKQELLMFLLRWE